MIVALLLLGTADSYDAVLAAERQARDCEMRVIGDAFLSLSKRSMDEWHAEARRECTADWNDHAEARRAYFHTNRQAVTRRVPGFRPDVEVCWDAFNMAHYNWPAAKNTALEECKNARN